ncbi:MAG: hypothetical protein KIS92_04080 [Planctomycetota bacterium]|nr:hypothetical protein [Planctomycetota bacterium]
MNTSNELARLAGMVVLNAEKICESAEDSDEPVWHALLDGYFQAVRELQAFLPQAKQDLGLARINDILAPAVKSEGHVRDKLNHVCDHIRRELAVVNATRTNLGRLSDAYAHETEHHPVALEA